MYGKIEGTGYEILDKRFEECIIPHARVERLWTGGRWCEGPAWFAAGRYLLWSDIPNDNILRFDETDSSVSIFRHLSHNANGNTVDRCGRLVTCEHQTRRVVRTEIDGSQAVIADRFGGKRFNSPNDVVVSSDGAIWFTDPTYGIMNDYEGDLAESEIGGCHVYRVDPIIGTIERVADDFCQPNGLAFSPNEEFLYVSDTGQSDEENGAPHIRRFSVSSDGELSGGEVFLKCPGCVFDGFRVDRAGRIWTSARDGVHCYDASARFLGRICIPEWVANLTFGGPKLNRLFICATSSLYSVVVATSGIVPG
ncbi:MAG: gluconolactonase [Acidiferrobacteraceae bacterium]|nr:gluconolactonase [Acidiferrobacteraceae bacterium]|tara:strand:- start:1504 stop:2430 length:927 start_codon:yes stop_codon:yes gene_type:complete